MSTETNAPTIEERYSSAVNTSNLKVERDHTRNNIADILIAAGWSRAHFGTSLLRLQSEWDSCAKPRALSAAAIRVLAGTFEKERGPDGKVWFDFPNERARVTPADAARYQASEWHLHELGLLFQRLKTLPQVRDMLMSWGSCKGIESAGVKAASVVAWWLNHTCPMCNGGGYELVIGTNRQSNRLCTHCKGSKKVKLPYGLDGAAMVGEIERSLHQATCSMGAATSSRRREKADGQTAKSSCT